MAILANASLPTILPRLISLLRLNKLDLAPRFINTFFIYFLISIILYNIY